MLRYSMRGLSAFFRALTTRPECSRRDQSTFPPAAEVCEERILLAAPLPSDVSTRSLLNFSSSTNDVTSEGGWSRNDRFTNISDSYRLIIDDVQAIFLTPDSLGYGDIFGS